MNRSLRHHGDHYVLSPLQERASSYIMLDLLEFIRRDTGFDVGAPAGGRMRVFSHNLNNGLAMLILIHGL